MDMKNKNFIPHMINRIGKQEVIVPELSDGVQPLHAIYSRKCLPRIKKLFAEEKLKITGFYRDMRLSSIPEEEIKKFDSEARFFLNLNTLGELKYHQ